MTPFKCLQIFSFLKITSKCWINSQSNYERNYKILDVIPFIKFLYSSRHNYVFKIVFMNEKSIFSLPSPYCFPDETNSDIVKLSVYMQYLVKRFELEFEVFIPLC